MKRKITSLTTAIIVLFLMLITFPNTSWGQEKTDYEWVLTDFEDLTTSDIFVIVGIRNSNTYILEANGASKPKATAVSIDNNKISSNVTITDAQQWHLGSTNTTGEYYVITTSNSTDKYLYNTKNNKDKFTTSLSANGTSSSAGNVFTLAEYTNDNTNPATTTNMLKVKASERYVCVYIPDSGDPDWRAYTSGNDANTNQTATTFYKRQEASSNPTVTASPTSLSGFSYVYGEGPSTQEKYITVSGSNLSTNNLVVTASSNYEVCKTIDGTYTTSVEYEPTTGTVSASAVYVRLKANLSAGSYNSADDKLTVSSTGATNQTVALSGTVIPKYTLTISATNGHIEDGDGNTLITGAVAQGTEIEITAVPNTGYKFASWSVSGTDSSVEDDDEITTTFTMGSEDATLTANFEARTPITVTLHDGNNGATETTVNTYTDATLGEVIANHLIATVNGWTALGWVKSYTSGTPTLINNSEAVGSTNNLYAVYKKGSNTFSLIDDNEDLTSGTYIIGYNHNGTYKFMNGASVNYMGYSTGNTVSEGSFEYVTGEKFVLGGSSSTGYTLSDGDNYLTATSGQQYLGLSTGDLTNYMKWDISFSNGYVQISNKGNSSNKLVSYHTGQNYFNCWTSSYLLLYKQITNDLTYSITPVKEKCHVTYDANGATSGSVPEDGNEYDPGDIVTVLDNTGSLDKTGHTFNTWNSQADGNGTDHAAGSTFTIAANTTLYAKWAVQSYGYTLTDDAHSLAELEVGGESYSALTIPYGTEVEVVVDVDEGYTYFISVKDENDNDVKVEDDVFTMPASTVTITVTSRLLYKYIQVTNDNQLVAGKHYVIASGTSGNSVKGAGYQKAANRNAVAVEFDNDGKMIENNLLWDFVLSGDATNGWTFYDKYTDGEGFLCAPTTATNSLTLQTTLADNGKWSVSIGTDITDYKATVVAKGGTRKNMRYNSSGSGLFNCYANSDDQSDIYLFVKYNDDEYEIYSPTPMSGDQTVYSLVVEGTLTIKDGATLEVLDELINDNPANLIIEDGGQLITSSSVQLTYKKGITSAAKDGGWYTISTPVHTASNTFLTPGSVENLILASEDNYDFFRYDEASHTWMNYKQSAFNLNVGQGYLYRNNGAELHFAGYNNQATSYNVALSYASTEDKLLGFNLIGNPYPQNITMSDVTVNNDGTLSGGYVLSKDGAWSADVAATIAPAQGFLVQIDKTGVTATITKPTGGSKSRANNDYIKFIVANSQHEDAAFALFEEGYGLNKIDHRNSDIPMLYIPKEGHNFAIATMDDNTQSFNLNLKAKTTGKYTLTYKATGNYSYLHVIDRLTGEDVDMLMEGEYSFIASPSDAENRFIVRLEYSNGYENSEDSIFAYQSGSDIIVNGEGELQIFDMMGRRVLTQYVSGVETINLQSHGVYIFKLNEKTQKIVVR